MNNIREYAYNLWDEQVDIMKQQLQYVNKDFHEREIIMSL